MRDNKCYCDRCGVSFDQYETNTAEIRIRNSEGKDTYKDLCQNCTKDIIIDALELR